MFDTTLPFGGLFRSDTVHAPRTFDSGFRWEFYDETDLNESARALFHHLDSVFRTLSAPGYMFLSSIELDAEAGRFPDVLAQYFRDDEWDYSQSYFVAPIKRVGSTDEYSTGRLTFEALPGQTVRALAQNGGFRWGAGLRVWGCQALVPHVAEAIEMYPFDAEQARRVEPHIRAAWLADVDLNCLALWVCDAVDEDLRRRLAAMKTA
jgi:hypothetical protein